MGFEPTPPKRFEVSSSEPSKYGNINYTLKWLLNQPKFIPGMLNNFFDTLACLGIRFYISNRNFKRASTRFVLNEVSIRTFKFELASNFVGDCSLRRVESLWTHSNFMDIFHFDSALYVRSLKVYNLNVKILSKNSPKLSQILKKRKMFSKK